MLKNAIISVIAIAALIVGTIFYLESRECMSDDTYRLSLESKHATDYYAKMREAKNLCKQHVETLLNAQGYGFSKIDTHHQGATQLYRDVRVGVYGTSGGQIQIPELTLVCHTSLDSKNVLQVQQTRETFDYLNQADEDRNLDMQIFRLKVDSTRCRSNPLYVKQ